MLTALLRATTFAVFGNSPPVLLTPSQAAHRLTLSERTFRRRAAEPGFPPKVRLGPRRIAFRVADLDEWLESMSGPNGQSFG